MVPPWTIVSIIGTRPEAIKMAPVIKELIRFPKRFTSILVTTGQHRELLDQALGAFAITPAVEMELMSEKQELAEFAALCLSSVSKLLRDLRPSMVLVQGDTTSVAASALAAYYQKIPVGHVEAGLRSFDPHDPFPEELNRELAGLLADLHFVPTETARQNLLRNAVLDTDIFVTGNTIVDALRSIQLRDSYDDPQLRLADSGSGRLVVVTAHRRESHGPRLQSICRAVRKLTEIRSDVTIVFPVHPNPEVRRITKAELGDAPRVHLVSPTAYGDMLRLMKRACLILSDSGGIQEEAPSLHTPLLILRDVTERPEVVEVGAARLVGTSEERILREALLLLDDGEHHSRMSSAPNPFGDGHAAERIVEAVGCWLETRAGVEKTDCRESASVVAELGESPVGG